MHRLLVLVALGLFANGAAAKDIEKTFQKTCGICHVAGVAGAPKMGDNRAWAPRLTQGVDVLVGSVVNGKGAMPPKGLCADCSKNDYKALIRYMSAK